MDKSKYAFKKIKSCNKNHPKIFKKHINLWYYRNIFEDKLYNFLSNSIVTLGRSNWIVTNKKYGVLEVSNLTMYFENESDYQLEQLETIFGQWYGDKMIEITQKEMWNL